MSACHNSRLPDRHREGTAEANASVADSDEPRWTLERADHSMHWAHVLVLFCAPTMCCASSHRLTLQAQRRKHSDIQTGISNFVYTI